MDILLSPHLFSTAVASPFSLRQAEQSQGRKGMDALAMVGCGGRLTVVSQHHNHPRNFTPAFLTKQKPFLTGRSKSLVSFQASPFLSSSSQGFRRLNVETRTQSSDTQIFMPHLVASMEGVEQSYIMIKPDGVQRGLVGEIISRFEKKGFVLKGLKLFQCPQELAEEHYKDLKTKSFFPKLIDYITSGPVVCMAWEGVGVVQAARKLIGSTNPLQAEPGTIRGDLAVQTGRNVVHGSDSPENGQREVALWFSEGELCHWTPAQAQWLNE